MATDVAKAERSALIGSIDIHSEVERWAGAETPDPHPVYREHLARGPVFAGDIEVELLGQAASTVTPWDGPHFTVLGYEEITRVFHDSDSYSNRVIDRSMGQVMGRNILSLDDPEHRVHRLLVQSAFSRRAMEGWRGRFVEPLVESLIDSFEGDKRLNFMRRFAMPFPTAVIHRVLGLPEDELEELTLLSAGLFLFDTRFEVANACSERIAELIAEHIEDRRRQPRDDVITVLANERLNTGESLTDEEIVNFLRVLLPAGAETTTRLLGAMMVRLLGEPGLLDRVRDDLGLVPKLTQEALRLHPPFQFNYRLAVRDAELAGTPIPEGSTLSLCQSAANRDPRRFSDPDTFDLGRTSSNLGFGLGMHVCLGVHLARMEADVAFRALLSRLPDLRLDEEMPPPKITGVTMMSPSSIHLRWD